MKNIFQFFSKYLYKSESKQETVSPKEAVLEMIASEIGEKVKKIESLDDTMLKSQQALEEKLQEVKARIDSSDDLSDYDLKALTLIKGKLAKLPEAKEAYKAELYADLRKSYDYYNEIKAIEPDQEFESKHEIFFDEINKLEKSVSKKTIEPEDLPTDQDGDGKDDDKAMHKVVGEDADCFHYTGDMINDVLKEFNAEAEIKQNTDKASIEVIINQEGISYSDLEDIQTIISKRIEAQYVKEMYVEETGHFFLYMQDKLEKTVTADNVNTKKEDLEKKEIVSTILGEVDVTELRKVLVQKNDKLKKSMEAAYTDAVPPSFKRQDMPQIKDIHAVIDRLDKMGFAVSYSPCCVNDLTITQSEIDLIKCIAIARDIEYGTADMAQFFFLLSSEGVVVDGNHRAKGAQIYNPLFEVMTCRVPMEFANLIQLLRSEEFADLVSFKDVQDEKLMKAKYTRREGSPGNYKYFYDEPKNNTPKKSEDNIKDSESISETKGFEILSYLKNMDKSLSFVEDGIKSGRFNSKIDKNGAAILNNYTSESYRFINRELRKNDISEKGKVYKDSLNSFLDTLDNHEGEVYRAEGAWKDINDILSDFEQAKKSGQEIEFQSFTSTTKNKKNTDNFGGDIVYSIKSKTGKSIESFSDSPGEQEVLFKTNTQFKIKKIKPVKIAGKVYKIEISLEES